MGSMPMAIPNDNISADGSSTVSWSPKPNDKSITFVVLNSEVVGDMLISSLQRTVEMSSSYQATGADAMKRESEVEELASWMEEAERKAPCTLPSNHTSNVCPYYITQYIKYT